MEIPSNSAQEFKMNPHASSFEPDFCDDFYKKLQVSEEKLQSSPEESKESEKSQKVYTSDFLMSFQETCKTLPPKTNIPNTYAITPKKKKKKPRRKRIQSESVAHNEDSPIKAPRERIMSEFNPNMAAKTKP